MPRFRYRAIDKGGRKLEGKVEAQDASAASRLLQSRGLIVVNLASDSRGIFSLITKLRSHVGLGDLTAFTRQLATMITAGVTVTEALSILKEQVGRAFSPIVDQILADVEAGSSLSSAFEKHPRIFSPVYVALVRAGETGGILDQVLARLADNLEKQREFHGKVIGALIYPMIIVVGMVIVATIMILFVVPRLSQLYQDFQAQLPLSTRILIAISALFTRFWWMIALFLGLLLWGFSIFAKTPAGKRKIDELILRIPILGALQKKVMLTEFTRTLGLLVGSGVSILESLRVVSSVTGNQVLATAVERASNDVERGFPLAWGLGQQKEAFPVMVSRMIAVGEETGKVPEVLAKVSSILEVESEMQVRVLTASLEPIIMITLGIGVGFLVMAIILPIYNLTSQL